MTNSKKSFRDFDIFNMTLLDSLDHSEDTYPFFTKKEDNDSLYIVKYHTSERKELIIKIPKSGYILEVVNSNGGEVPKYAFLKKIDNKIVSYNYAKHPNTFNRSHYETSDNPRLHMIIPGSIKIITKDTLYYYSIDDEQSYPFSGNSEMSGINKVIQKDSIDFYKVLPFTLDTDSIAANKIPFFKEYYNEKGLKFRELHSGEIFKMRDYRYSNLYHKVWRGFHDTSSFR